MRRIGISALLSLALAVTSLAAPHMTLPEAEFNFGYAPQHTKISHVFWLKSSGDDTLKIVQVVPGCGCTKAPLQKDIVAPGDSTPIEITFETGSYTGPVSKNPTVKTNEGAPDKQIRIKTTVVPRPDSTYPVVVKPYKIDISQVGAKTRDEITFTLVNRTANALTPRMVASVKDYFDVTLPKSIPRRGSAEGTIRIKQAKLNEQFDKSFTIEFDDDAHSRYTIPVKRQIRADSPGTATQTSSSGH